MARGSSADRHTEALRLIIDGTLTGDEEAYRGAAVALEDMADTGDLPRGDEFYATACSALCYDVVGMRRDAVRMYRLLGQRYSGEFEYIVGSAEHARRLAEGLAALGLGDGGRRLVPALDGARSWLRSQEEPGGGIDHDSPDDYNLFFALLNLLCRFFRALRGPDSDGEARDLAEKADGFHDDLLRYYPDPPLGFMVSLYLRLVKAVYGRSVSRLDVDDDVKEALWKSGRYALSGSEGDAVAAGLLDRASLLCRLPAPHEKPLLACLCMGASRRGGGAVAYLAATKGDAERMHGGITRLLGASRASRRRDAGGRDARWGAIARGENFVATYGELGLRLHERPAAAAELGTVIIDEACDLDGARAGDASLELDMLLARLRAAGPTACPRIVALTTRASGNAARRMADWLGARPVDCGGDGGAAAGPAPSGADVSICHGAVLYRQSGPDEPAPLPRDLRCPDAGALDAAGMCARFARRSVVTDAPVLISVPEGSDVVGFAGEIASRLRRMGKGDLDLRAAARKRGGLRRGLARRAGIAAGLEYCGPGAAPPLAAGVAFDDEGLPREFRGAVAGGVEEGSISAVVSSSVPPAAAGRSPFKTVLLCSPGPRGSSEKGANKSGIDIQRYERVAEMAGRGGRDKRGEIFVLAGSEAECGMLRRRLWGGAAGAAPAPGGSADGIRPRIAAHLVRMAVEAGGVTLDDVTDRMSLTWLWSSSSGEGRGALGRVIEDALGELVALRLVTTRRNSGGGGGGAGGRRVYEPTELGRRVCVSPLPALWAARAVRELEASWGAGEGAHAAQFYADAGAEGAAAEGGAGVNPILYHHAAARSGLGTPAPSLVGAKAAAVARARTLLGLADLMDGGPKHAGGGMQEELGRVAIQHLSGSFGTAADLLEYCAAHSERERAAFLVDHLAGAAPGLREIAPLGGPPPARAASPRRDAWRDWAKQADLAAGKHYLVFSVSHMQLRPAPPRHSEHAPPSGVPDRGALGDLWGLVPAHIRLPDPKRGVLAEIRAR